MPAQEHPESGGYPCRAIRTVDYLYVRNFRPDRWPAGTPVGGRAFVGNWALADCDDGPTKSYMVAHRDEPAVAPLYAAAFGRRPAEELYDLRKDEDQLHDVARDPTYDGAREVLARRLEAALEKSGDPRIRGEGARFDRFPYYGRLRPGARRAPDYDAHVAALERKLPSDDFHIVVQPPFVVIGDEAPQAVRRCAEHTVKWAVDRLKDSYFEKDPEHVIDVWLFKDEDSYATNTWKLFNERPTTPYGYYSSRHRALIMDIHTGTGTLVHEIVHPFMAANFAACPAWFNEGLASLYEQCGETDGRIVGYTNWRLPVLKRAFEDDAVTTFEELTGTTTREFYADGQGVRYAQARYLCYYLQEQGLLRRFYREFRAGAAKDPSGYATLKKVLGREDMDEFEHEWRRFVLALRYE